MIYFLYGPDSFRSRKKLEEIIEEYKKTHKSGLSFYYLNLGRDNFKEFEKRVNTTSLFSEKKLLVIENVNANKIFQEEFIGLASKSNIQKDNDIMLVFIEYQMVDTRKLFFKFLMSIAKTQEFRKLKGAELRYWVVEHLKAKKKTMDSNTLYEFLVFAASLDTWGVKNELDKLIHYSEGRKISVEDIKEILRPEINLTIFELLDAIGSKNKKRATFLFEQMLETGESEVYVLSMIAYALRNLIQAKSFEGQKIHPSLLAKKLKIHPYVLRKSQINARHFSIEELKKIYQRLAEIDLKMKTGKVNPRLALEMFVTSI